MIYLTRQPIVRQFFSITEANYDYLCQIAGEYSLAVPLNAIIDAARKQELNITICNSARPLANLAIDGRPRRNSP